MCSPVIWIIRNRHTLRRAILNFADLNRGDDIVQRSQIPLTIFNMRGFKNTTMIVSPHQNPLEMTTSGQKIGLVRTLLFFVSNPFLESKATH